VEEIKRGESEKLERCGRRKERHAGGEEDVAALLVARAQEMKGEDCKRSGHAVV